MNRDARAVWTESELRGLLTSYFGHKLEPHQLSQLLAAVSDALSERGRMDAAGHEPDSGHFSGGA